MIQSVCGNHLIELNETITEHEIDWPGHNSLYPPNIRCTWKIIVPPGQQVAITFNKLDIEETNSATCTKDYLEILDSSVRIKN